MMAMKAPIPRLIDIIEAAELIYSEMSGVTLNEFEGDRRKRWLIERGIEFNFEASRRLGEALTARHPEIPWPKVAAIGKILRHEYQDVAPMYCWTWSGTICPHWKEPVARSWRLRKIAKSRKVDYGFGATA